jgi:hypothetical protein
MLRHDLLIYRCFPRARFLQPLSDKVCCAAPTEPILKNRSDAQHSQRFEAAVQRPYADPEPPRTFPLQPFDDFLYRRLLYTDLIHDRYIIVERRSPFNLPGQLRRRKVSPLGCLVSAMQALKRERVVFLAAFQRVPERGKFHSDIWTGLRSSRPSSAMLI